MTSTVDLGPAADHLAALVAGVPDGPLDGPTPCGGYAVGDLIEHLGTMAVAFTAAATKRTEGIGDRRPTGDVALLPDDWRDRIPRDLAALASAWRDPVAWEGDTRVGGVDLPGGAAGVIALDELVVHGWDLARATGQPFEVDPVSLAVVHGFVADLATPERATMRDGIFGPIVEVTTDDLLDQVLGLTGRNPSWHPS